MLGWGQEGRGDLGLWPIWEGWGTRERSYGAVTQDWPSQLGQSVSPIQAWDAPPSDDTVMTAHMHWGSTGGVQGTLRDRQTKTAIFWALGFLRGLCLDDVQCAWKGLPHGKAFS